jgi:hypothetical protein
MRSEAFSDDVKSEPSSQHEVVFGLDLGWRPCRDVEDALQKHLA